jgi:hypothetical protein
VVPNVSLVLRGQDVFWDFLTLKNKGSTTPENGRNHSHIDTTSYPSRPESPETVLGDPQILQVSLLIGYCIEVVA